MSDVCCGVHSTHQEQQERVERGSIIVGTVVPRTAAESAMNFVASTQAAVHPSEHRFS